MERNLGSILGARNLKKKSLPICALSVSSLAAGWAGQGNRESPWYSDTAHPAYMHNRSAWSGEQEPFCERCVWDQQDLEWGIFIMLPQNKYFILADFIRLVAEWSGNKNSLVVFEERAGGSVLEKVMSLPLSLGVETCHPCPLPPRWRDFFLHHILLPCIPRVHSCKGWRNQCLYSGLIVLSSMDYTLYSWLQAKWEILLWMGLQMLWKIIQLQNLLHKVQQQQPEVSIQARGWKDWEQIWEGTLLWRTGWESGFVQPGKEKPLGKPQSSFPDLKGGLKKVWRDSLVEPVVTSDKITQNYLKPDLY